MFSTKIGGEKGINIGFGPPGFESSLVTEFVLRESKKKGLSTKKSFNRLDRSPNTENPNVVSIFVY